MRLFERRANRVARKKAELEERKREERLLEQIMEQKKTRVELISLARALLSAAFKDDVLPKFRAQRQAMNVCLGEVVVMAAEIMSVETDAEEITINAYGKPLTLLELNFGTHVAKVPLFFCEEEQPSPGEVLLFDKSGLAIEVVSFERVSRFQPVPKTKDVKKALGFPGNPERGK